MKWICRKCLKGTGMPPCTLSTEDTSYAPDRCPFEGCGAPEWKGLTKKAKKLDEDLKKERRG